MTLFHIPQYTIQNRNVYISVLNGALDMGQVHWGIDELDQLQLLPQDPVKFHIKSVGVWISFSYDIWQ